jgi:hypothetical protein
MSLRVVCHHYGRFVCIAFQIMVEGIWDDVRSDEQPFLAAEFAFRHQMKAARRSVSRLAVPAHMQLGRPPTPFARLPYKQLHTLDQVCRIVKFMG